MVGELTFQFQIKYWGSGEYIPISGVFKVIHVGIFVVIDVFWGELL